MVGLAGAGVTRREIALSSWFGVRGVGSIYYLAFAITHGASGPELRTVTDLVLAVIATSIVIHGISVTPLMKAYGRSN